MRSMNRIYQTLKFLNGQYDIDRYKGLRLSEAIELGTKFRKGCKEFYISIKELPASDTDETEYLTCSLGAAFEYLIAKDEKGNLEILSLPDDEYNIISAVVHYLDQLYPYLERQLTPPDLCILADLYYTDKLIHDFLDSQDTAFREAVISLKGQWSVLKMSNTNIFDYDEWNKSLHQLITDYNDFLYSSNVDYIMAIEDPRLEVARLVKLLGW